MKYNFIDENTKPKSVTVITPTIGQDHLLKAIESVDEQTYPNVKHLVVIDGPDYAKNTLDKIRVFLFGKTYENLVTTVAPENTGKTTGDYWGHRIYAGYSHLVNSDYVAFLDEDNWYEPNHIETLVKTLEDNNHDWVYSLRKIYHESGEYLDDDCCESLGKWPVFWSLDKETQEHLVDTSSYLYKRSFLINVAHLWHNQWGADRKFYQTLTQTFKHTNYGTNGKHTLCYRLDDNVEKKYGNIDFFKNGNQVILKHYGEYPWAKKT